MCGKFVVPKSALDESSGWATVKEFLRQHPEDFEVFFFRLIVVLFPQVDPQGNDPLRLYLFTSLSIPLPFVLLLGGPSPS